ncbi:unnamed protein product [Paramecium sonneborni]|uniref:Photosystem I assembly protein Ycf3 n=1 Tax=Paramecium sonneborni TaxID=65129 RepID=A0A8S1R9F8_9CILI|nr:unnamed protein product [Paramecium sonneborni]
MNHFEEAVYFFDQALNIDSINYNFLKCKDNALINLNHLEEAIEFYDKALHINPNSFDLLNNKSLALLVLIQ